MIPKKVVTLTVPLFPYLRNSDKKPQITKRIRPRDALNLKRMLKEIRKSEVAAFNIAGKPWSLVSVYSSYSPDIHVMLIETSPNRYVGGPERISEGEGDRLMKLWAAILDMFAKRKPVSTIHAGYNWSPRAWGKEEERTGFQSLPTKWHPHLWGWPALSSVEGAPLDNVSEKKVWYAKEVDTAELSQQQKRLLGDNDYAEPFGMLVKKRMGEEFSRGSLFCKLFPHYNWHIDARGIYTRFPVSVPKILRTPEFFGKVLKPLASMLEEIMRELTETFTTIRCRDIDRILMRIEKGNHNNLKRLRTTPVMRPEKYIKRIFKLRGYPKGLLKALWWSVWDRCHERGDPADWWRKGFAYALVFNGPARGNQGELRIMPGVYVGPGGVVEAEGYIITRPEDKKFSENEIRRKSKNLRNLAENLKKLGFG
jgi:hypothetical protein